MAAPVPRPAPSWGLTALLLGMMALGSESFVVNCTYTILNEDHRDNNTRAEVAFRYGVCTTTEGVQYVMSEPVEKLGFLPLDVLRLNLQEDPDAAGKSRSTSGGPKPIYELSGEPVYKVNGMLGRSSLAIPAGRLAYEERDLIIIRMAYTNGEPSCDENCVREGMFTGNNDVIYGYDFAGNVADQVYESSYGQTNFPENKAVIVTVNMGKAMPTQYCPTTSESSLADSKVPSQHGIEPRDYTHREYWLPSAMGGCTWAGLGSVGCAPPGTIPRAGACQTWIRNSRGTVRAHEFGHNYGLSHGGVESNTGTYNAYGDYSSIMGISAQWKSFIAPDRDALGWFPSDVIRDPTMAPAAYKLAALIEQPLSLDSEVFMALKFWCSSCVSSGITGGYIYISFRTNEGYDKDLEYDDLDDKVFVHIQRKYYGSYGQGTELLKVMDEFSSRFDVSAAGYSIKVCSLQVPSRIASVAVVPISMASSIESACSNVKLPEAGPGKSVFRLSAVASFTSSTITTATKARAVA